MLRAVRRAKERNKLAQRTSSSQRQQNSRETSTSCWRRGKSRTDARTDRQTGWLAGRLALVQANWRARLASRVENCGHSPQLVAQSGRERRTQVERQAGGEPAGERATRISTFDCGTTFDFERSKRANRVTTGARLFQSICLAGRHSPDDMTKWRADRVSIGRGSKVVISRGRNSIRSERSLFCGAASKTFAANAQRLQ